MSKATGAQSITLSGVNPLPHHDPANRIVRVESFGNGGLLVTRLTTADGSTGWGQAAWGVPEVVQGVLHGLVAPRTLGQDAADPDALSDRLWEGLYKFHGSLLARAIAGVDTAVWDLAGRKTGRSVCAMLGGTPRPLAVYASSMARDNTPEAEIDAVARACDTTGARAAKIKIGPRRGVVDPSAGERTRRIVPMAGTVLRKRGVAVMVDANGSYTADEAIEVGKMLQDNGVVHYEEPCPHDDLEATARVAAALDVPVAGGEQDFAIGQFRRMLELRAVDRVQFDVGYVGGPSRAVRVARLAGGRGVGVLPHSANHSMLLIFTLHLAAALPNAEPHVEWNLRANAPGQYHPTFSPRDGSIAMPDGDGWGVEPEPAWLEQAVRTVTEA